VEQRAAFDAWLHADAGLSFQEAAEYTPQELARLQLGWMIREQDYGGGEARSQKQKIKRGQQQARQEMYQDLGIE
jgi:hypothetical protein